MHTLPTPAEAAELLADVERADTLAAALVPPACPLWCAKPSGHGYSSAGREAFRIHESAPGALVTVEAVEDRGLDGGPVVLGPAAVLVREVDDLDVDAARELAAALVEAAGLLERIGRS